MTGIISRLDANLGYIVVSECARLFVRYFLWKWLFSLTLPGLIWVYALTHWEMDFRDQVLVSLTFLIVIKNWYDTEILRARVERLEQEAENHYFEHHAPPSE